MLSMVNSSYTLWLCKAFIRINIVQRIFATLYDKVVERNLLRLCEYSQLFDQFKR